MDVPTAQTARQPGYPEWMELAAREYDRLIGLLRGLDDDQWLAPTDCAGWRVREVVAHLAGAAAGNARLREFGRQALHARRRSEPGDLIDRINAVQVEERSASTAAELLAELADAGPRGVDARRRLPRPVRALRIPFGPPLGTRPLGFLMGCCYTRDAWMHRIDLARAAGVEPLLTPDHDGALVADVVAEWAGTHGQPVDLILDGPAGGHWRYGDPGPDAHLRLDAVDFARTLSGRAPGRGLLATPVPF